MAFTSIPSNTIEVGDPIKKELFDLIKNDLDDLDSRVTTLSLGASRLVLFNIDVIISSIDISNGIAYYQVPQDCLASEFSIQLFEKAPATSGTLAVDIKKASNTNDANFVTILTTAPTLNMATASDYQRQLGVINPASQNLLAGDILRIDITSLPQQLKRFRIYASGVV